MPTAIITGSGGLIGSESVRHFVEAGYRRDRPGERHARPVLRPRRIDGTHDRALLERELGDAFSSRRARHPRCRRHRRGCSPSAARTIELVIHTAAQPSHDWAASDPQTDFAVNANGTLNLLEATRRHAPAATFIFCSTNKVYGDLPNGLPLVELEHAPGAARRPPLLPAASTRRCRSTPRRTRCSASPRRLPTCSCRSTAATSACPPCASAAAA